MAGYSTLVYLLVGCLLANNVEGSSFKCNKQGRFPVPSDCGSFVDCFLDSDGEMIRREGHCWGFPYSPSKKYCVSHDERPGCKAEPPTERKLIGPVPDLSYHCVETDSVGCHHCYLGYNCIDGKAYVNICEDKDSCTETPPFNGSCLPQDTATYTEPDCYCNAVKIYGDHFNLTYYHFCDIQYSVTTYQCPEEQTFNDASKECEAATTTPATTTPVPPPVPECTGTGTNVNPNDCQYYYVCLPDGAVQTGSCEVGEYFNQTSGTCLDSCNFIQLTPTPDELCPAAGKYRDPTDCTKYNICLGSGSLYKTEQCPIGTYFSEDADDSGSCVSGDLPAECLDFDYTQCPDYEGLSPCIT